MNFFFSCAVEVKVTCTYTLVKYYIHVKETELACCFEISYLTDVWRYSRLLSLSCSCLSNPSCSQSGGESFLTRQILYTDQHCNQICSKSYMHVDMSYKVEVSYFSYRVIVQAFTIISSKG